MPMFSGAQVRKLPHPDLRVGERCLIVWTPDDVPLGPYEVVVLGHLRGADRQEVLHESGCALVDREAAVLVVTCSDEDLEKRRCPRCHGEARVLVTEWGCGPGDHDEFSYPESCWVCGGTGRMPTRSQG